jgi:hypothetical protein
LIQLLQWLQVLSSLGEEEETFRTTVKALDLLTPAQLLSAATNYRVEVGEQGLPKKFKEILKNMESEKEDARRKAKARLSQHTRSPSSPPPSTAVKPSTPRSVTPQPSKTANDDEDVPPPSTLLLPSATLLPFALPTSTEMITSYGAGIGGTQREKYIPTLSPEFMEKLDNVNSSGATKVPLGGIERTWVEEEDVDEERDRAELVAAQGGAAWGQ